MGLFNFIKNKLGLSRKPIENLSAIVDRTGWTGRDFEFLIVGDIDVFFDFDNIMTPNSLEWISTVKNDWNYYQIGNDEFSYSIEETGIQMTFNNKISFEKAKIIADEVIKNIEATGQRAELLILDKKEVYLFD